jgi:hypothetical protein
VASRFRGQVATMTSAVAVAMILTACASHAGGAAVPSVIDDGTALRHHRTFLYTGRPQQFTVPPNVTRIMVEVVAAVGAGQYGGLGGRVWAIVPVTPGENLGVYVGGEGSGSTGGFNGGANGGGPGSGYNGSGGAGASDIRVGGDRLTNRILVAGGGGGQGGNGGNGGKGGRRVGGFGGGGGSYSSGNGGGGGTQHRGGSGGSGGVGAGFSGSPGDAGSLGHGGGGGAGGIGSGSGAGFGGAGGGGGYYGGGGGGGGGGDTFSGASGGGGGGGSSYVEPGAFAQREWRGWKNATGNGIIVFSW